MRHQLSPLFLLLLHALQLHALSHTRACCAAGLTAGTEKLQGRQTKKMSQQQLAA